MWAALLPFVAFETALLRVALSRIGLPFPLPLLTFGDLLLPPLPSFLAKGVLAVCVNGQCIPFSSTASADTSQLLVPVHRHALASLHCHGNRERLGLHPYLRVVVILKRCFQCCELLGGAESECTRISRCRNALRCREHVFFSLGCSPQKPWSS